MSKMGISTVSGYTAAQVFEAIGLSQEFIDEYFTGTSSKLGGGGLDVVAREAASRHRTAYPENPTERAHRRLDVGGEYAYRREGEQHLFTPETVFLLQHATRTKQRDVFRRYTAECDRIAARAGSCAGSSGCATGPRADRHRRGRAGRARSSSASPPGAMSYGSISAEAHTDLAIAMNNIGGRSNTGEGGEDPVRLYDAVEALGDQAGRLRALRRDQRVPGQRRGPADQDGAGREARRGRPARGQEGLPVDRRGPALDARRRADLAAPAPRHLLHRGPQAAHPRPQERQRPGPDPRQAGQLGRGRDGRGGGQQGPRRRRAHLRLGRRHRRRAPDAPQARRARRGRSGSPTPSRPSCSTACATASRSRSTAA